MTGVVDLYFIALSALEQFIMLRQLYIGPLSFRSRHPTSLSVAETAKN